MADVRQPVTAARTPVIFGLIATTGDAAKVEIRDHLIISAEQGHDLAPFLAMGPDATPPVNCIGEVMRHFMRDGYRQIFLVIPCKEPGIVANASGPAMNFVHARKAAG